MDHSLMPSANAFVGCQSSKTQEVAPAQRSATSDYASLQTDSQGSRSGSEVPSPPASPPSHSSGEFTQSSGQAVYSDALSHNSGLETPHQHCCGDLSTTRRWADEDSDDGNYYAQPANIPPPPPPPVDMQSAYSTPGSYPAYVPEQVSPLYGPADYPPPTVAHCDTTSYQMPHTVLYTPQTECHSVGTNDTWRPPASASPTEWVIGVQFKYGRAGEFLSSNPLPIGSHAVVDGDRGEDIGMVIDCQRLIGDAGPKGGKPTLRVIRRAENQEAEFWQQTLSEKEREAKEVVQEVLSRRQIPMRVVHAEFQLDMNKLTFHFVSQDPYPRFREALPECYAIWKCRIWFARYTRIAMDSKCRQMLNPPAADHVISRPKQVSPPRRPRRKSGDRERRGSGWR